MKASIVASTTTVGAVGRGSRRGKRAHRMAKNNHKVECYENGCSVSARFGYVSDRKRAYCSAHRLFAMVNLDKPRADAEAAAASSDKGRTGSGSTKHGRKRKADEFRPSFSSSGGGAPRRASVKRKNSAAKVKVRPRTKAEMAVARLRVGGSTQGTAPGKSGEGGSAAARGIYYKKCVEPRCARRASFGVLGHSREYCLTHHLPGMINLVVEGKKARIAATATAAGAAGLHRRKEQPTPKKKRRRLVGPPLSSVASSGGTAAARGAASPAGMTRTPVWTRVGCNGVASLELNGKQENAGGVGASAAGGRGAAGGGDGGECVGVEAKKVAAAGASLRKGRCRGEGDCDLTASFGFPGGLRESCSVHQREGMVNLTYNSPRAFRANLVGADGSGGGGGGGGSSVRMEGKGKRSAGAARTDAQRPPKKLRGVADGGGVGEGADGSRHRVWEGSKCGVCGRMAKLGECSCLLVWSLVVRVGRLRVCFGFRRRYLVCFGRTILLCKICSRFLTPSKAFHLDVR